MTMHKYPLNYIVWDLETTGLSSESDKIIEIGAVKVKDGKVVHSESWLLNHGIELSDKTREITGITQDLVDADGVHPHFGVERFLTLFEDIPGYANVSHNGFKFDFPFLKKQIIDFKPEVWELIRKEMVLNMVDTAVLYKAQKLGMQREENEKFHQFAERIMSIWAKGVKYNIPLCCEELEIDTSKATFHRAVGDATLTNEIYKKLCLS